MSTNPTTLPLLKIGQRVTTPLGPGTIVDIEIIAGIYQQGKHLELEPPQITVKLDKTGEEHLVCPCKIGLADQMAQQILRQEYHRLWPPVTVEETITAFNVPQMFINLFKQNQQEQATTQLRQGSLSSKNYNLMLKQINGTVNAQHVASFLKWMGLSESEAQEQVKLIITALIFKEPKRKLFYEQTERVVLAAVMKTFNSRRP